MSCSCFVFPWSFEDRWTIWSWHPRHHVPKSPSCQDLVGSKGRWLRFVVRGAHNASLHHQEVGSCWRLPAGQDGSIGSMRPVAEDCILPWVVATSFPIAEEGRSSCKNNQGSLESAVPFLSKEKNTHPTKQGKPRMKTHSFYIMTTITTATPTICRRGRGIKSVFIRVHDKWDRNNNDYPQVHSYNLHENHDDTEEYWWTNIRKWVPNKWNSPYW